MLAVAVNSFPTTASPLILIALTFIVGVVDVPPLPLPPLLLLPFPPVLGVIIRLGAVTKVDSLILLPLAFSISPLPFTSTLESSIISFTSVSSVSSILTSFNPRVTSILSMVVSPWLITFIPSAFIVTVFISPFRITSSPLSFSLIVIDIL